MPKQNPEWTILSSHGMVLLHIAATPQITLRELSDTVDLSERWISQIVKDLSEAGMLHVERRGLHNHYAVNPDAHLRHPTLAHIPLRRIITAVVPEIQQASTNQTDRDG